MCRHVIKETKMLTIHASMEAYVYTQMLYKCESIHLVASYIVWVIVSNWITSKLNFY